MIFSYTSYRTIPHHRNDHKIASGIFKTLNINLFTKFLPLNTIIPKLVVNDQLMK